MRTSSECRGLRKQAAVHERGREVGVRLALDDDTTIDDVVADGETLQLNIEVAAVPCEIKQRSVPFRKVDAKQVPPRSWHGNALGIPINSGGVRHMEGKAKGPRSGETTNGATTSRRHLRASAPPTTPPQTTNEESL